jgi:hypothetical protein
LDEPTDGLQEASMMTCHALKAARSRPESLLALRHGRGRPSRGVCCGKWRRDGRWSALFCA